MNNAFRLLFDQIRSGVVWIGRNGHVRYANKAAVHMTPFMLDQPLIDPHAHRAVSDALQGLVQLPHQFELRTQEANPDIVTAVVIAAPVGNDLMLVLNNVSREQWFNFALENLIRYVEADLAEPIDRLMQDLTQIHSGADRLLPRSIEQMTSHSAELSTKLGLLRDLVQVFGKGAIQCTDRLPMSRLLRDTQAALAPLLSARNVRLDVSSSATDDLIVYGSETWLPRAIEEFVDHAVRAAAPGAVIQLSLSGTGARVVLRSRNRGFVSDRDRRKAFVPFGVGDDPRQALPRIGMALARRVVEEHGGQVRIEDADDVVDFVLELPAGAPAGQEAQLSAAQAQRYAHDMAKLMSRVGSQRRKSEPS